MSVQSQQSERTRPRCRWTDLSLPWPTARQQAYSVILLHRNVGTEQEGGQKIAAVMREAEQRVATSQEDLLPLEHVPPH